MSPESSRGPAADSFFGSASRQRLFNAVKYLVYFLLTLNIGFFLQEELLALEHTFVDGFDAGQIIQVFSSTIDTAAWVLLLLLFELETAVLDDTRIHGAVKWALHGIRGICYIAVVYAFQGYCAELATIHQVVAMPGVEACSLLEQGFSLLQDLDEYAPLDASNCASVAAPVYRLEGFDIIADGGVLAAAQRLAWVDVINSGAWILVVVLLEVEVRLQLRGDLSQGIMKFTAVIKLVLYGTLFAAAIYWGVFGDFLDFWDASLWLFAFIFIELNVFEWQHETSHESGSDTPGDADSRV